MYWLASQLNRQKKKTVPNYRQVLTSRIRSPSFKIFALCEEGLFIWALWHRQDGNTARAMPPTDDVGPPHPPQSCLPCHMDDGD
jgi:hypothetical protein